jgi:hypothetical protein
VQPQDGERWVSDPVLRAAGAPVLCLELVGPYLSMAAVGGWLAELSLLRSAVFHLHACHQMSSTRCALRSHGDT